MCNQILVLEAQQYLALFDTLNNFNTLNTLNAKKIQLFGLAMYYFYFFMVSIRVNVKKNALKGHIWPSRP